MSKPPHRLLPGATYFVSTATWERRELFRVPEVAEILVRRILACRDRGAFLLHEFVAMPNHFHLLMTPGETTTLERAIQLIKGGSSHEIHAQRGTRMEIWQIGFHEWSVRDAEDYLAKVAYIRMNPVRARLVERPEDWAFGSASGRFSMDPAPEKFMVGASGAKAPEKKERERPFGRAEARPSEIAPMRKADAQIVTK